MVSLTASSLSTLVNDTTITAATAEIIIDQAVNTLNLYGASLSNMTGVAGAKTLAATSAEAGAILDVAVEIYSQYYVSSGAQSSSYGIGGLSVSQSSGGGGGTASIHEVAMLAAHRLIAHTIVRT